MRNQDTSMSRDDRWKIKSLEVTCDWCPAQIEVELGDGRWIYARNRHGITTFQIGLSIDSALSQSPPVLFEHTDQDCIGPLALEERVREWVAQHHDFGAMRRIPW